MANSHHHKDDGSENEQKWNRDFQLFTLVVGMTLAPGEGFEPSLAD